MYKHADSRTCGKFMEVKDLMNIIGRALIISWMVIVSVSTGSTDHTLITTGQEGCQAYKQSDAELNRVYLQILNDYKQDTVFTDKLRAAQRTWIAFRDAHVESLYPAKDKNARYGSIYSMCQCLALKELTDHRVSELKKWIEGVPEGESCAGSVKIKR
jgi:uncharacterized protein YecT (DUF1311 family)